jgi:hypothetical protein
VNRDDARLDITHITLMLDVMRQVSSISTGWRTRQESRESGEVTWYLNMERLEEAQESPITVRWVSEYPHWSGYDDGQVDPGLISSGHTFHHRMIHRRDLDRSPVSIG